MNGIAHDFSCILRGFRMMVDFNKLVFAFLGVVSSIIWVLIIVFFFSALGLINIGPFELVYSVLVSPRLGLSELLHIIFITLKSVDGAEYAAVVVLVLGLLVIWSIVGGAITRLAALEFAKEENLSFKDSLSYSLKKFWSYFWSPITPVVGVLFFAACNILGGLLGQISYVGGFAVAIGFPLAILSGFLIIFIGIIGIVGFFLMFPTISAEGSDAFDAMSRSYSYVISRPKHFLSLFLGIIICGTIFTIIISCIACLVMKVSFFTVGFGMGHKFELVKAVVLGGVYGPLEEKATMASLGTVSLKFTALMLTIYIGLAKVVVGSFVVSFAGSASTIAYFLLRKDVDGTDIHDVYVEDEEGVRGEMREEAAEVEKTEEEKMEEMKDKVKNEVRDELKKEVNEVKEEVKNEVRGELKKEINEAKEEVKREVKGEVRKEVDGVKGEVKKDVKDEVKKEVNEAKGEVTAALKEEVKREVKEEVKKEVSAKTKDTVPIEKDRKETTRNIEEKDVAPEKPDNPPIDESTRNE